jgi:hypothetical protein
MTRERIAGFLLGISVGTAIGFFLRPPNADQEPVQSGGTSDRARKMILRRNPQLELLPSLGTSISSE